MSDMPVEARCLDVLDELVSAWCSDRSNAEIRRYNDRPVNFGPVLFGLVSHTITLADGLSTFWRASGNDDGKRLATLPIVRQIIEFGIRAIWIERFPTYAEAFVNHGARQRVQAIEEGIKTGHIDPSIQAYADLIDMLDEYGKNDVPRQIDQALDQIKGTDSLYGIYRVASNYVHPGLTLTDMYLQLNEDSSIGTNLVIHPNEKVDASWLGIAASFTIHACLAWDRVDRNRFMHDLLRDLATEFQISRQQPEMTDSGYQKWQRAERARIAKMKEVRRKGQKGQA